MAKRLLNASMVLTPTEVVEQGAVIVGDDGRIAYVGTAAEAPAVEGEALDLDGRRLLPGLIDIHVHGGNGVTFGIPGQVGQDLRLYSEWVAGTGVTGFLCSLDAPDAPTLVRVVEEAVAGLDAGLPGAEGLGIHLEGPFLNPAKKGAFNPAWLRQPTLAEAEGLLQAGRGWIRQMTMAPELPEAQQVAARMRAAGVVVALGHSDSDFEAASAALRGDFTHVTHTFNAQRGFTQRQPGVFGAVLASDKVTAELIADTIHVHPGAMKILLRCLGTDRVVLITDAMTAAGLSDGRYDLVGNTVVVKDGRATLLDGTIAGSTATLSECVRNVNLRVGVPLPEAVKMASLNPARAMGLSGRLGSLAVGKDASLTVVDEDMTVWLSMVKGKVVYSS
jgi:N-acetylglucosamine-6-phosphate deacetylase